MEWPNTFNITSRCESHQARADSMDCRVAAAYARGWRLLIATSSSKMLLQHLLPCHVKLMRSASLPNGARGPWCVEYRSRIFELLSPASACPPSPRLRPCRGRRGRLTVVDVVDAWTRTGRTSWTSWTRTGKKFHPAQKPGTEAPCDRQRNTYHSGVQAIQRCAPCWWQLICSSNHA